MHSMKKSGRISFVLLAVIVAAIAAIVVFVLVSSEESPETVGSNFLRALAKGDLDTLTKLSYMDKTSDADIHKKWDYTINTAGPYFRFIYRVKGSSRVSSDSGAVIVSWTKDVQNPTAYAIDYEIPMLKIDHHWKVDVRSLNRDMFPGLPQ